MPSGINYSSNFTIWSIVSPWWTISWWVRRNTNITLTYSLIKSHSENISPKRFQNYSIQQWSKSEKLKWQKKTSLFPKYPNRSLGTHNSRIQTQSTIFPCSVSIIFKQWTEDWARTLSGISIPSVSSLSKSKITGCLIITDAFNYRFPYQKIVI